MCINYPTQPIVKTSCLFPKFQGHYRKRRITLTEEEYQKVVKEVEDKLRESAWETMMEQDKDADE